MRKRALKLSFGLRFLDISLMTIGILELIAVGVMFIVLYRINQGGDNMYSMWVEEVVIFFLSFEAIAAILLINIVVVLDRTLAPLSRIEKILSEVLAGNSSLRLQVRKKDLLGPLVDKINQLIERIESK